MAWLSHTDLSDLSIVGTCDILVIPNASRSHWLIQSCYQSASSRVTERAMCKMFQKYLSEENSIILSPNTVIPNHFYGLAIKGDSMPP